MPIARLPGMTTVVATAVLMLLVVVSTTVEMEQEATKSRPLHLKARQPGKQNLFTRDGKLNKDFDHKAILGDSKLESLFEKLPPNQAKQRLRLLVKNMNTDHDGFVTKEELKNWVFKSFRHLDDEDSLDELEDADKNEDGLVDWSEYLKSKHKTTEDELKKLRSENDGEHEELLHDVDDDEKRFAAADLNKDGFLDKSEFNAFHQPQNFKHMHQFAIDKAMYDHDQNKDGFLSLQEFLKHTDQYTIAFEKRNFKTLDVNKDGFVDKKEVYGWVIKDYNEDAEDEASHLIEKADVDKDGKLTADEIVDAHETFVGSSATMYGMTLRLEHMDEL